MSDRIAQAVAEMRREAEGILVLARVVDEIGEPEGWQVDFGIGDEWAARWREAFPSAAPPFAVMMDQYGDIGINHVAASIPSDAYRERTRTLYALRDRVADAAVRARRLVAWRA